MALSHDIAQTSEGEKFDAIIWQMFRIRGQFPITTTSTDLHVEFCVNEIFVEKHTYCNTLHVGIQRLDLLSFSLRSVSV